MNLHAVFARVMARKSRLFKSRDYDAMLDSNSVSELLNYLSSTPYKKEIMLNRDTDLSTLQSITHQNYAREVLEIYKFSSDNIRKLLQPLFLKLDMLNLIVLIRGKVGNLPKEYLKKFIAPSPYINPRLFFEIYGLPLNSLINSLSTPLVDGVKMKKTPSEMENIIFINWLKQFLLVPKKVKPYFEKALFAHDTLNRLKSAVYSIDSELVGKYRRGIPKTYAQLINFVHENFGAVSNEPELIETEIEKYTLKLKSVRGLRNIDAIINYIDSKEVESRNIRIIGAGVVSNFNREKLKEELIYENSSSF
ncbi:MAG: V-type ATPase subunit [Candidatus Altiarchaeota archaeon]|nr:V-type ATPase subunit [Candidatus Altiarchaeota archaeon]